jgi:hypothetical protein
MVSKLAQLELRPPSRRVEEAEDEAMASRELSAEHWEQEGRL